MEQDWYPEECAYAYYEYRELKCCCCWAKLKKKGTDFFL